MRTYLRRRETEEKMKIPPLIPRVAGRDLVPRTSISATFCNLKRYLPRRLQRENAVHWASWEKSGILSLTVSRIPPVVQDTWLRLLRKISELERNSLVSCLQRIWTCVKFLVSFYISVWAVEVSCDWFVLSELLLILPEYISLNASEQESIDSSDIGLFVI